MKRRIGRLCILCSLLLCFCQAFAITGWAYTFETDAGVEISMDQDASEVLEQLGKAESYYEAQSSSHQGKEKVFTYDGFELSTYPSGGSDYVKSIWFLNEETVTPEGIHIGSTIDEMKEAYGDDYTEENGKYQYVSDEGILAFYTKKGAVSGIEYKFIGE